MAGEARDSGPKTLLMDDRQADWMGPHLTAAGFTVKVRRLAAGDFVWDSPLGRVGVEDKPLKALMDDRHNTALDDELRRLCEAYAVPILMVRGTPWVAKEPAIADEFGDDWGYFAVANLLLGRQFHGVYVDWCPTDDLLGTRLLSLMRYLKYVGPLTGWHRERMFEWVGPLTGRAEVIYTVLGQVGGIRDRRGVAERIAAAASLVEFLAWDAAAFRRAGFTKLMAGRLAAHCAAINSES